MQTFPNLEQVNQADREQLARWHRFLPSAIHPRDQQVQARIFERFQSQGGMTPEISKHIGWGCA